MAASPCWAPQSSCQDVLGSISFSRGSASNAISRSRMSHSLRPLISRGGSTWPDERISSKVLPEMPRYIAASSRDNPRRGKLVARIFERERFIWPQIATEIVLPIAHLVVGPSQLTRWRRKVERPGLRFEFFARKRSANRRAASRRCEAARIALFPPPQFPLLDQRNDFLDLEPCMFYPAAATGMGHDQLRSPTVRNSLQLCTD